MAFPIVFFQICVTLLLLGVLAETMSDYQIGLIVGWLWWWVVIRLMTGRWFPARQPIDQLPKWARKAMGDDWRFGNLESKANPSKVDH